MATREQLADVAIAGEQAEVLGPPRGHVADRGRASASWRRARVGVDVAMLVAALLVASLGFPAARLDQVSEWWLVLFAVLVIGISFFRGAYDWRVRVQPIDDCWSVVVTTALAAMTVLSLRVVFGEESAVAGQTLGLFAVSALYVAGGRVALDCAQARGRREGDLVKPTLIVGAGNVGNLVARRLLDHPEFGLRPVGYLDKDPLDSSARRLPILGASWDLEDVVKEHGVQHVIVTFSRAPTDVLLRLVRRCEELGVEISLIPRLYEQMSTRLTVEHVGGLPLLSVRHVSPKGWQFAVKYAIDRLIALLLLPLALPFLAAAAVAVYLSVGRPVFFRQPRVGRDGRVFEMLKFRTMRGAPPSDDLVEALMPLPPDTAPGGVEGGDRRSRVGAVLRATSIDELPQLLNVLRGEMSLVGPRPERPEFVRVFEDQVPGYADRHRVKAGITGWAQVNGLRGKTSISDRAEWDNFYIANWSLWLDFKILLLTIFALLTTFRSVE